MGYAYKITNQQGLYYVTFTVKDWVDVFTRNEYRFIITNSLNYCIKQKGLEVYAWVLMTNHLPRCSKCSAALVPNIGGTSN